MTEHQGLRMVARILVLALGLAAGAWLGGCGGDGDKTPLPPGDEAPLTPPTCTFLSVPGEASGLVSVSYEVVDLPASFVNIQVDYTTDDGATFHPTTPAPLGDGTQNLAATPEGAQHAYAWQIDADLPAAVLPLEGVWLRLEATEVPGGLTGVPCTSEPLTVVATPHRVVLPALSVTVAQDLVELPLEFDPGQVAELYELELLLAYDPALLQFQSFRPGAAQPPATIHLSFPSPGLVRVVIETVMDPLVGGELLVLEGESSCQWPDPLPQESTITCRQPVGHDGAGEAVPVVCGDPGPVTLLDGGPVVQLPDTVVTVGAVEATVALLLDNGDLGPRAEQLELEVIWDTTVVAVTGAVPGGDLGHDGTVTLVPTGPDQAIVQVINPAGVPLPEGKLALLQLQVLGSALQAPPTTELHLQELRLRAGGRCPELDGRLLAPVTVLTLVRDRTLLALRAVSALGARGTPQLVTGSVVPRNPTGSWVPLGTGEYNATVSLWDGGNPILFSDTTSPPRQLVLEAEWSAPPFFTDVAAATTAEGSTTYSVVRGSGHVLVGPDGQVTPAEPNACSVFLATFAPGGPGASGTPLTVAFAACVDLGGIDLPSREDRLTVGELDADLPGQPLGPPTPGPGGTVDITVYVNGGTTSVGTYEVEATWDPSILGLDLETTDGGFLPPSDPDLGGPSVVDSSLPGRIIGRHSTPSTSYSGIFDIWTLRLRVLESGTTSVTHTTRQLTSSEAVPTTIGPPTPRPAPAASTDAATFP